ncbi:MAG: hypothetical protein ACRC0G_10625 [Fusobacteriaceae bacterium]
MALSPNQRARQLRQIVNNAQDEGKKILAELVEMSDLRLSLIAFQDLEEILPTTNWIPDRADYPLFREYLDGDNTWRREGVYGFLDRFEEEVWYHTESTEEERAEIAERGSWDPNKYVPLLWEVLKNGHGKFTLDW